jgi:hypothetical protein
MTRSIFDPGGPDTERSGNPNLGPDARNASHMPPSVVDGEACDHTDAPVDPALTEAVMEEKAEEERERKSRP